MASISTDSPSTAFSPRRRAGSAAELLLGSVVVIGHNVFRILPNEVPILVVLGLVSVRLRDGGFSALGFRRPASWARIVIIAVAAATVRIVLAEFVIDPVTARFWPAAKAPAGTEEIAGNIAHVLIALLIVWSFAAFGEEIAYRGYLLTRAADIGSRSTVAYWVGMIVVSVLFGYGHYYKGPSGKVDSGVAGFILGSAYLLSGRNLWTCILAHGFIDTFGVTAVYLGWET
ncbi:MAG TPA: CPBP family intramembrane glutamic endopeptidase [Pyrinomonadaceae bacterium]